MTVMENPTEGTKFICLPYVRIRGCTYIMYIYGHIEACAKPQVRGLVY